MGFFAIIKAFLGYGSTANQPARKRRGDEIFSPHNSKIRCMEDSDVHGESSLRLARDPGQWNKKSEGKALPKTQLQVSTVVITKWGQNGKENCGQYFHSSSNSNKTSVMDHRHNPQRDNASEIPILEANNERGSKLKKRKENMKLAGSCYYNTSSRNALDVKVNECSATSQNKRHSRKDVEVIKHLHIPQASQCYDTDVEILRDYGSSSKNGQCIQGRSVARKPFKVLDSFALASSTPLLLPNRRPLLNSPEPPEIEILDSPRMANGLGSSKYRSQSSILSSDSNNSRTQSTLNHMKRAEDYKTYSEILRQVCAERTVPQRISQTGHRFSEFHDVRVVSPSTTDKLQRHLVSPKGSRVLHGITTSGPSTTCERINIPVDQKNESEPSTASRRMSVDPDLEYLGQKRGHACFYPDSDIVQEILIKYQDKKKDREKEIEAELRKAELLGERNQLARLERSKRMEADLSEQIQAYLRVTEEYKEEEKDAEIPPLPELTEEMQMEIDKALSARPDQVLVNAFNLTIKGRDMATLKPLAWLNDEVINFYMNLLIERGKCEKYPKVYAFNTFFFPKLIGSGYDSLKRWTRKVDVFAHDYLLVPVHRGMHWCMAIVNMKKNTIRYYDSMNGPFPQCPDALLIYLQKESLDKKKQPFDTTGWVKEHAEGIPQQNNGSDCGMFACMYAEYVSREAPITFTQDDMPYFRRKAVYEILKAKLLC